MVKRVLLVFTVLFLMVTVGQASENWVYVTNLDGGWEYYYDANYCKLININGYDVWKLRYKVITPRDKDNYFVLSDFYNLDNKTKKHISLLKFSKTDNKCVTERTYDNNEPWYNVGHDETLIYDKIISKLKEDK